MLDWKQSSDGRTALLIEGARRVGKSTVVEEFAKKEYKSYILIVQDHRYDYIETGSLITIRKNVKDILIPSEERRISMYPMDYEEFLWALGDETTFPLLGQCYELGRGIGESANRRLLRQFRLYMLVGGMPQAVNEYLNTNNFKYVDAVKRDILNLYEDDFMKIDPTGSLSMIFDSIPAQLNSNASRFQPAPVLGGTSTDKINV